MNKQRALLRWYDLMAECFKRMPWEAQIAFLLWDANRSSGVRTSDWPGWINYIGPRRQIPPAPWESKENLAPAVRAAVFARDGKVCRDCGSVEDITIDHVRPVARGGNDELTNLQVLCRACNSRKGARWP